MRIEHMGDATQCFTSADGLLFFGFTRADGTETPLLLSNEGAFLVFAMLNNLLDG